MTNQERQLVYARHPVTAAPRRRLSAAQRRRLRHKARRAAKRGHW